MTSTATLPGIPASGARVVQPALRRCIEGLAPELRQVIAYHLGFADRDGRPASARWKAVRPALAFLSAQAVGAAPDVALPGAVAVGSFTTSRSSTTT